MPLGPTRWAPASAWADAHAAVDLQRGVVVDPTLVVEHAAVAVVGELVEAQVGHHEQVVAGLGAGVGDGDVEDAVRVERRRSPVASLCSGTPNSMTPPSPSDAASATALRADSRECCTTPGMLEIGRGSRSPSATNIGSTSCRGSTDVSATSRRIAGDERRRRGRSAGNMVRPSAVTTDDAATAW